MADAPRVEWKVLALQLFVLPAAIVAACVGVFLLFGRMSDSSQGARDLLAEIRSNDGTWVFDRNARWYAAYSLTREISRERESLRKDPRFLSDLLALFQDRRYPDSQMRGWLAVALGKLADPSAAEALAGELSSADGADREFLRYACAWALGALGDRSKASALVPLLRDPSPSVRKVAAYALGALGAREELEDALDDASLEVRWTAAVWLGRLGAREASPALAALLDRAAYAGRREDETALLLEHAARAAGMLGDPALAPALERLKADPSATVRLAAEQALLSREAPPPPQDEPIAPR